MDKQDIRKILLFRIYGLLPERFHALVDRWIAEDSTLKQKSMYEIWKAIPSQPSTDSRKALNRVYEKAGMTRSSHFHISLRYAAVLLVLLLPVAAYFFCHHESEPKLLSCSTAQSEMKAIVLPDSTKVILNSSSSLSYPSEFPDSIREVSLKGEALFHVKHNASKPFIVKSGCMRIHDLGTIFNVNSYDPHNIIATLAEGSVDVWTENKDVKSNYTVLKPGQQAEYNSNKRTLLVLNVTSDDIISWTHGDLYFFEKPLGTIVKGISDKYGVQIIIQSTLDTNLPVTIRVYHDDTIDSTIKVLAKTIGANYEAKGKDYIIY